MKDFASKYKEAIAQGYSDSEIAQHFAGSKYKTAVENGYNDSEIIQHFTGVSIPDKQAWSDPTLAGRDARYSQVNAGVKEGLLGGIRAALPGSDFDKPIEGQNEGGFLQTPLAALRAAGQTLQDPTRISSTFRQPGQVAGEYVDESLSNQGAPWLVGKGAKFATEMALDPQSYMFGGIPSASKAGGAIEEFATQQANKTAGISAKTVANIAKSKQNPAEVGKEIGKELIEAGALKGSASKMWQNVSDMTSKAGKSVENILTKLRKTSGMVEEATGEMPHAIEAKVALEPLAEAWTSRASGMTSARKAMAKPFEEVYNGLAEVAKKQNGKLTLDNIKAALDEVGPMVHKGSEEVRASMSELYGALADMRDKMVERIAKDSGDLSLGAQLIQANKKYSMYIRLLPDIAKNTAKEAVGKGVGIDQPVKYVVNKLGPKIASAALATSKLIGSQAVAATGKAAGIAALRSGFKLSDIAGRELQSLRDRLRNNAK